MQRKFQAESRGNGAASADAISGKIDRAIRSEMKCNVIPSEDIMINLSMPCYFSTFISQWDI